MSSLNPDQWQVLSPYLDEALTLSDDERARWLETMRAENPSLADKLRDLLNEYRSAEGKGFLENSPNIPTLNKGLAGHVVGSYRLVSLVGLGGMGAVWLAERCDGRFERKAAVKFLNIALLGQGGEERFKREGAILGRFSHPNIAELLDAGVTSSGQPYIVLEYVEGKPIDRYCDEAKLDVKARLSLFLDVLAAVAHAHANLIVHRDIKPTNVLVSKDGQVKLLDFGIAKLLEGEDQENAPTLLTRTGDSPLTPEYAAPEQITGAPITIATDIYTLGVLLYQLLSGRHPAGKALRSPADLVKAIVDTEPLRPSTIFEPAKPDTEAVTTSASNRASTPDKLRRLLQGDLDTIVGKALKKDPQERYSSVTAMADDLRRYLKHEPISARPDTLGYRTAKFVRRNRLVVGSVALFMLALAGGLGAALWEAHVARRQTQVATEVERFLEDIFEANSSDQPDPVKARQTTAREMLDIGAKKIDTELAHEPEAKLHMLNTLGRMYLDLGMDGQASEMYRKSVALARAQHGNDSPEVVEGLTNLANMLRTSGSSKEAGEDLLEAKRILDKRRDFTSRDRAEVLSKLAMHFQATDLARALDYSQQAVEVLRRYPEDDELSEAIETQVLMRLTRMEAGLAEPLAAEAVRLSIKLHGDPNPALPRYYATLAQAQRYLLEFAAAEDSLHRAVLAARKVNGDDHVDTLQTEARLGDFLVWSSRSADGLAHLEQAKEILLRTHRGDDPFYAPQVYVQYGWALAGTGRPEDALVYISKAVEIRRKSRPGTQFLGQMLEDEVQVLVELGRYAEAGRLADEASEIAKQVHAPVIYNAVDGRARLLVATGQANDAEAALDAFHPVAREGATISPDALKLLVSRSEIALARGDAGRAIDLAAQVRTQLDGSSARPYLKGTDSRAALAEGRGDLMLNRSTQALPLLQRAVELREATQDPLSPDLADARVALANCYLDLHNFGQAKAAYAAAARAYRTHPALGAQYARPFDALHARLSHAQPIP